KENIVSKAASQVGGVVKQMVEAGSSAVKKDKSTHSDDSESKNLHHIAQQKQQHGPVSRRLL
ncbi:MAG: hypothetical protein WA323_17190, partial [Candidatus Nitrosopolaris sp.]